MCHEETKSISTPPGWETTQMQVASPLPQFAPFQAYRGFFDY